MHQYYAKIGFTKVYVTQVKYLLDDSNNFLSLASFQNKYHLKVRPLTFFGYNLRH